MFAFMIVMFVEMPMRSCMHLCENLGGRLPGMNSLQQVEVVSSLLREKGISPYRVWTPLHDEENEGEWRDILNHQVLNFTPPWGKGEPNWGINENCAAAVDSGIW